MGSDEVPLQVRTIPASECGDPGTGYRDFGSRPGLDKGPADRLSQRAKKARAKRDWLAACEPYAPPICWHCERGHFWACWRCVMALRAWVLKTQAQREARAKFNERILPRNGGK
jgi:hypothetical protein